MLPILGLLGGIGSGKSTVARQFARMGADVIEADQLARESLLRREVKRSIVARAGAEVLGADGELDRECLARWAFAEVRNLRALNRIIHPLVRARIVKWLRARGRSTRPALSVLDVPLLVESGWQRKCRWLAYVHAPRQQRYERLRRRRGWTVSQLRARERHQLPVKTKREMADFIIDNSKSIRRTAEQVARIVRQIGLSPSSTTGSPRS